MRVVIDGRKLRHNEGFGRSLARLLQAWTRLNATDELHLVVSGDPQITVPDRVIVHQFDPARSQLPGHLRVRRLCRSLQAHVLLGLAPSPVLARPRSTITVNLHDSVRRERARVRGAALSGELFTWSRFTRKFRLSLVDRLAAADWQARRFKLRPSIFGSDTAAAVIPLAGSGVQAPAPTAPERRADLFPRPSRQVRWIAAVSASTLALSAVAAASVDLVASHNFPVTTPHHLTGTGGSHSLTVSRTSGQSAVGATTSSTTAATSTTSTTPTTVPTPTPAATGTPSAANQAIGVPGLKLPTLTLPTVTLPSIPTPTVTLPTLCSGTTTTTTPSSSPLSINLCGLNLGNLTMP